ncbi:hypothetical protein [Hoeflea sp. TYP-13]|uniref:hypothetical protein n=1 Tax=Hoeflea sp. TYP-13 TaxID=3230023 RepID=UPI0034C5F192
MEDDWQWLIGVLTGVFSTAGIAIAGAFRSLYRKISAGDKALHERIESVKDDYVSKDHLDTHLNGIKEQLDHMKADSERRHGEAKERHAEVMDLITEALK